MTEGIKLGKIYTQKNIKAMNLAGTDPSRALHFICESCTSLWKCLMVWGNEHPWTPHPFHLVRDGEAQGCADGWWGQDRAGEAG